jgi:hypothetical protein
MEGTFERGDLLAERGLGDGAPASGGREARSLGDGDEVFELAGFHRFILSLS